MMYDREKSDLAIVAVKPTNKAGRSAAELVEPRAGTKGNAGQQSTDRTPSRATVTQALERIRRTARERKKERFTALLHHITPELLEAEFFALEAHAAAGAGGGTMSSISRPTLRSCMDGSIEERIGHCRRVGSISRSRTDGSVHWRLRP